MIADVSEGLSARSSKNSTFPLRFIPLVERKANIVDRRPDMSVPLTLIRIVVLTV